MGVAVTDMIMFFFLGVAVAITVPIQWHAMGGWEAVETAMTDRPEVLDPLGGLTVTQALYFMIIALTVYADPAFYQRFSASDSPKAGRRAMLTCLLIWVVMDAVLASTGMMVNVTHPELDPGTGYVTMVLETLPVGIEGPVCRSADRLGDFRSGQLSALRRYAFRIRYLRKAEKKSFRKRIAHSHQNFHCGFGYRRIIGRFKVHRSYGSLRTRLGNLGCGRRNSCSGRPDL